MVIPFIIVSVAGYMIGSISFSIILCRWIFKQDIRDLGSGNAGATNVYRNFGWKPALVVFLLDFSKGFLPVFFLGLITQPWNIQEQWTVQSWEILRLALFVSLAVGHGFPLWFGFKGGKAVATSAGAVSALIPLAAPICLVVFISLLYFTRKPFVASISTAWSLPPAYLLLHRQEGFSLIYLVVFIILAIGITWLHRKNIAKNKP
ncbi:MAG: glycerol-3-phosphate 1-O-acyltransferase PlsY [Spirochaetaceae bacterium]|jgi:glycerol-3-phosphate acyltransferase PlsY|nr:glycerol-3-phosphate 1-O-acyltransferase PlsY [Spirochaetaceae bacterium]